MHFELTLSRPLLLCQLHWEKLTFIIDHCFPRRFLVSFACLGFHNASLINHKCDTIEEGLYFRMILKVGVKSYVVYVLREGDKCKVRVTMNSL